MSRPALLTTAEMPHVEDPSDTSAALRRRRLDAARVRRRRLLLADAGIGLALGLLGLLLAPGLAIAALGALIVLVGCALSAVVGLLLSRRRAGKGS